MSGLANMRLGVQACVLCASVCLVLVSLVCPTLAGAEQGYRKRRAKQGFRRGGFRAPRANKPKPPPPPPYIALTQQAISRGQLHRAVKLLTRARTCYLKRGAVCGFAQPEYDAVLGIVYLEHGALKKSAAALRRALWGLKAKQKRQRLTCQFYLGQALYRLGDYRGAAKALRAAEAVGKQSARYYLMRSRAELRADQARAARLSLARGLARFANSSELWRELAILYAELGFYGAAAQTARRSVALSKGKRRRSARLMLADFLRRARRHDEALAELEALRLQHPKDRRIGRRLAYYYAYAGRNLAAARLFERLASAKDAHATAAQYRLAGRTRRALSWNARVVSGKKRLAQRARILIAAAQYQRALAVYAQLDRRHGLSDQQRYRMAYVALKAGAIRRAATILRQITSSAFSARKKRLATVIRACQKDPSACAD
jgi:hypothetical protein